VKSTKKKVYLFSSENPFHPLAFSPVFPLDPVLHLFYTLTMKKHLLINSTQQEGECPLIRLGDKKWGLMFFTIYFAFFY
jgi:hypothetical protein